MRHSARLGAIVVFAISPILLFYSVLLGKVTNLPYQDDYDALLAFADHLLDLHSFHAKLVFFLSSQHNEYKLFFENAVVWAQVALLGHVDLRFLCLLGDAVILPLVIVLWKMFRPVEASTSTRLALFIPVLFLLSQLQYQETLNWAMAGLQNLPVLLFSILAIHLLAKPKPTAFAMATACMALAIASSGNGLLLVPIGLLILLVNSRYAQSALWLAASAAFLAAYFYHYDPLLSQSPAHRSVLRTILDLRPLYVLAFLGAAGRQILQKLSVVLGAALCCFFAYLLRRGYLRKNPAVVYSALFLILTAVGVAGIRSDFGLLQSLSSRYNMYSALLLCLAWMALVEEFPHLLHLPLRRNRVFLATLALTVVFSLVEDTYGWYELSNRNRVLVRGMVAYERTSKTAATLGPILPLPHQDAKVDQLDIRARKILTTSIAQHTYVPPQL